MNRKAMLMSIVLWSAILYFCTGCMPAVFGVKEIQTAAGTNIKFITGGDFHIGGNGVDTIDDRRGIKPGAGYQVRNAKY